MRKFILLISLAFFSITLPSCSRGQVGYQLTDFDSYETIDPISKTDGDDIFLGRPQGITMINGWLAIDDVYDDMCITWVSPDLKSYVHNVRRGMGPGEISSTAIPFRALNPDRVIIQDFAIGKFYTFTWDNVMKSDFKRPVQTDEIGDQRSRAVPMGGNYVCYEMMDNDENMFSLLSPNGEVLTRFGDYPPTIDLSREKDAYLRQVKASCRVSAKTDGTIMVAAGFCYDYLAFYRINGTEANLIKQYNTFAPDRDIVETSSGYSFRNNSRTINAYGSLSPSDKYLFALYDGNKVIRDNKVNYVFLQVFDWEGNFIRGYKLNERIGAVAYDENSQTLYGIAAGDFHISVYRLSGL